MISVCKSVRTPVTGSNADVISVLASELLFVSERLFFERIVNKFAAYDGNDVIFKISALLE